MYVNIIILYYINLIDILFKTPVLNIYRDTNYCNYAVKGFFFLINNLNSIFFPSFIYHFKY